MHNPRERYDHAQELRKIADEIERLPSTTHRNPEEPSLAKRDLVQRIRAKADKLVRTVEPTIGTVFGAGVSNGVSGKPFVAEVRRIRKVCARPEKLVA